MASFKLNLGRIRGLPKPRQLDELLESYGLPESEEYGVLKHAATEEAIQATIVRRTHQSFQKIDPESRQLTAATIEKVTVYPFAVFPKKEQLEVYAGSAAGLKEIGVFLSSALALSAVVDSVELDVAAAIETLAGSTQRFVLRSARVSDFAHNSYLIGPYAPRFADSAHGKEFLDEHAEGVTSASVRFQGPTGRVTAGLTPAACFSYSCHEDDVPTVRNILRKLL